MQNLTTNKRTENRLNYFLREKNNFFHLNPNKEK